MVMAELSVFKLVIAVLATWQIVETLRHGSNFRGLRRWGNQHLESRWPIRIAAKLAICAFCQSHWAPVFVLFALFYGSSNITARCAEFVTVSLAITRMTQLLNDLSHGYSRSPPADEEVEDDQTAAVAAASNAETTSDHS